MTTNLAKDALELRKATDLEAWLRANPECWPELRRYGWWTETIDRIEQEDGR